MQSVTEISSDLFLSIPIGLSIMDGNGRLIDANPFFCNSEVLDKSGIVGKTLLELGFLNFEESISLSHAILLGNGNVKSFDTTYYSKSKQAYSIAVTPYRFLESDQFLFTFKNITIYKSQQEMLTEKINSLENITKHLPAMIYNYCTADNGDMSFDFISNGCEELIGYTSEELINDFSILLESIHPEDLPGMMDSINASAVNYVNWEFEYRLKHKNGEYKWVQGRSTPFKQERSAISWIGAVIDISDRKRIEKEKELLEQRLYHSIEYTPSMAIQWYNQTGNVIYWNKASERLYGYLSEEAIGKNLSELIYTQEENKGFLEILNKINTSGEAFGPFETEVKNKNGENRTILATSYMIPGLNYEPVFVCMDFDITEYKQSQKELEKSEGRLTAITSILLDIVWILSTEDIIIYKSKESDILDQELGSNIKTSHVHPQDLHLVQNALVRLKQKPFGDDKVEYRIFDKNGNVLYLETFGSNQYDNPAINGLVLITRNITERKNAENEINKSHVFLQTLLNTIPVRVCWKDLNSRYLGANSLFMDAAKLIGIESLIGKSDMELFGEPYSSRFIERDKEFIENDQPALLYEESMEVNGELHWMLKSKVAIKDNEENVIGILIAGQDITERKNIEQNVRKKNEELVKINAELDRFVYSASHDLRAPIASVLGLIEVMKMENKPDMILGYIEKQKKALKKMDDFIQEIVHFSRNGRLDVLCEEVDLKFLVEEIFEQYNYLENAQIIDKQVTIKGNDVFCSDRQRLNVIFSNLISNSLKYSDSKKVNPYLHVHIEITKENAVVILEDNGEGIQEEYKEKIYDMFFRATLNSSGSGIGLYIVKEVINKLNGEIEFSSEFELGTCFKITIPNLKEGD
ncbi:MAG: PAS domain S-box protein [Opitutaceae bacterium]|nr:PAS domain S-box protein [Cytophagales bacterium]